MTKKQAVLRLAAEMNRYFTSANSVDVPARISIPRDEWRELYAAMKDALEEPVASPAIKNASQDWVGMDGVTAFWLIQRHADGWADAGKMMNEWLEANQAQPEQQEPLINRVANKLFGDIKVNVPNILPTQSPAESVMIDGVAYTVPAQVAAEMLRLHLEIKSARQDFVCSTGLCHCKAQQQEPVVLDVTIDGDAAKLLAEMLAPVLDEPTPIRLLVGNGHSGYGLYAASAEYQEEGAALLVNTPTPPAKQLEQAPIYFMRDNHTFKKLSDSLSTALVEIEHEFNEGWTYGCLCSKREGFTDVTARGSSKRLEFFAECKAELEKWLPTSAGKTLA